MVDFSHIEVDFSHIEQEIQEDLKDWFLATKNRSDRRGKISYENRF